MVHYKNSNYLDLLFQDLNSVRKIAVLLNGKMRTPKIEALHRLIDWLNAKDALVKNYEIPKLGLDSSCLGDNPWLAGFLEADGNFYCGYELSSEGIAKGVKSYMRVSQKQLYKANSNIPTETNSNFLIMDKIRDYLDVKAVNEITRVKDKYTELSYEVRTTKIASCNLIINYLSVYPLFSSKHLDFLAFCEIHHIRLSKQYKTSEGTSKLICLKNSMNTKRTQFNWDSLNSFYC